MAVKLSRQRLLQANIRFIPGACNRAQSAAAIRAMSLVDMIRFPASRKDDLSIRQGQALRILWLGQALLSPR